MGKKESMDISQYVKKQTFITAVVLSLLAGFIGGTVYSSFKLGEQKSAGMAQNQGSGMPAQQERDLQAEFAAKIMQLEQYLEQNPNDASGWANLGNLLFDSNQPPRAIEAYKKSLELSPGKLGVMTDLGVMYRRNNQPEKAVDMFDEVINLNPNFEQARFNKGIVLLHDLNDIEAGIQAWEELLEINPMAVTSTGETVESIIQRMKKQIQ